MSEFLEENGGERSNLITDTDGPLLDSTKVSESVITNAVNITRDITSVTTLNSSVTSSEKLVVVNERRYSREEILTENSYQERGVSNFSVKDSVIHSSRVESTELNSVESLTQSSNHENYENHANHDVVASESLQLGAPSLLEEYVNGTPLTEESVEQNLLTETVTQDSPQEKTCTKNSGTESVYQNSQVDSAAPPNFEAESAIRNSQEVVQNSEAEIVDQNSHQSSNVSENTPAEDIEHRAPEDEVCLNNSQEITDVQKVDENAAMEISQEQSSHGSAANDGELERNVRHEAPSSVSAAYEVLAGQNTKDCHSVNAEEAVISFKSGTAFAAPEAGPELPPNECHHLEGSTEHSSTIPAGHESDQSHLMSHHGDVIMNKAATTIKSNNENKNETTPATPASHFEEKEKDHSAPLNYLKNKYEGTQPTATGPQIPTTFREPRKLDLNWDTVVEEKKEGLTETLKEMDLLSCLKVQVNESAALFQNKIDGGETSPVPVNRHIVEKVAPPEITKNVRAMFETGKIADRHEVKRTVAILDVPRESGVYENKPAQPVEGLVRSGDCATTDDCPVQEGITKNLLSQWNQKGAEEFKSERPRGMINICEDDGRVLESVPVRRDDVVRADDAYVPEGAEVQKGATKSLLSQWKQKGTEEFRPEKKTIHIAEDDGKVLESQPIVRTDVVRCDESFSADGEEVQKGTTRSLLRQWKDKGTEEFRPERKPIHIAEDDGAVLENVPAVRNDVVNSGGGVYVPEGSEVQRGITRNLLDQWKQIGVEEFKAEKRPILIEDCEGRVAENEPTRRNEDVAREDYAAAAAEMPTKGKAKALKEQWVAMKDEGSAVREAKPIRLVENENEASVVENQPVVRTDVLREDDNMEEIWMKKGFARDLAGFWAGPHDDRAKPARDRPIDILAETSGAAVGPTVLENCPEQLPAGVVRADDAGAEETVEVERGRARNMANMWQNMGQEDQKMKQPFRLELDIDTSSDGVHENQPSEPPAGVVKNTDAPDDIVLQRGMIRNIAGRFTSSVDDSAATKKPKEMIVIDRADGPSVVENEPAKISGDVIRCDQYVDEVVGVETGATKNLVQRWKNQDVETATRPNGPVDPARILEAERAQESGVFENKPTVRLDVYRESPDDAVEMISVRETRNTREMWKKSEAGSPQPMRRTPEPVRFTPPREMSPPLTRSDFRSVQTITLGNKAS